MLPLVGGLTIGGVMMLDTDIAGAATPFDLDKIRIQEYRRDVSGAQRTLTADAELRLEIVKAIALNYMKPTTGTLAETIANDTTNDTARLRAAVNAVLGLVKNG